jgi:hypothetical protein
LTPIFGNHIINNKNGTIVRVVRAIKAFDCEFWELFKNKVTKNNNENEKKLHKYKGEHTNQEK